MAKKQRASEGESTYLAPETLPPPVAFQRGYDGPPLEQPLPGQSLWGEVAPTPHVSGLGLTQALSSKGWVAYRCHTTGRVDILTPARADGTLEGESKPSAAARMMKAIAEEYR